MAIKGKWRPPQTLRKLIRIELKQLNPPATSAEVPSLSATSPVNTHLTLTWLQHTIAELKGEMSELQTTLNGTRLLSMYETVDADLQLVKSDAKVVQKEQREEKERRMRAEAQVMELKAELSEVRENARGVGITCAKVKSQLKSAQLEWYNSFKNFKDKNSVDMPVDETLRYSNRNSRHQRIVRKHIIELERTTRELRNDQLELRNVLERTKQELKTLKENQEVDENNDAEEFDRINGNEVENFLKMHKINELKSQPTDSIERRLITLEEQQISNSNSLVNLTKQLTNFDRLHLSMLELLENVENVESKVDKNLPIFRKEISRIDVQVSEAMSKMAALQEDQVNTRSSVKAIGSTVSNVKERFDDLVLRNREFEETVQDLAKSNNVQHSKLHDHILKSESSTVELNATKSTIHLVQELRSFETEYKSIVNKLPHDCSKVSGPAGVYLIAPGDNEPVMAYCNEGWTTVQKRSDGSVNFNRNWEEYSTGFGSATGEHWLGNRNLHYLTRDNCSRLQVNMRDIYGKYWRAEYDRFTVSDYADGFRLVVGGYRGNSSDALDYQNRMEFSTVDNDRDTSNTHCASNYEGGWWFSHCQQANLNGRYNLGLTWFDGTRNEWIAVAWSEMRLRKRHGCEQLKG